MKLIDAADDTLGEVMVSEGKAKEGVRVSTWRCADGNTDEGEQVFLPADD